MEEAPKAGYWAHEGSEQGILEILTMNSDKVIVAPGEGFFMQGFIPDPADKDQAHSGLAVIIRFYGGNKIRVYLLHKHRHFDDIVASLLGLNGLRPIREGRQNGGTHCPDSCFCVHEHRQMDFDHEVRRPRHVHASLTLVSDHLAHLLILTC